MGGGSAPSDSPYSSWPTVEGRRANRIDPPDEVGAAGVGGVEGAGHLVHEMPPRVRRRLKRAAETAAGYPLRTREAPVSGKQVGQRRVVRNVGGPAVGGGHGRV